MAATPRRTLRNETLKTALKNFLVPCIAEKYHVSSMRALWDVNVDDMQVAELNIWAKRKQVRTLKFVIFLDSIRRNSLANKDIGHVSYLGVLSKEFFFFFFYFRSKISCQSLTAS